MKLSRWLKSGYQVSVIVHLVTAVIYLAAWDILAVKDGETVAIQVTSKSNMSARIKKISRDIEPHTKNLREANWTLLVHGWFKNKSNRWEVKEVDVS